MLIIFSGLPGVGKTSIAKLLARQISAVYLRIDSIGQCLINLRLVDKKDMRDYAYQVAYSIANDNLMSGLAVIADSVNPIKLTRDAWRKVALEINSPYLEVECICSHVEEHKRRVECRKSDIQNFKLPTWNKVQSRVYEAWDRERLIIDTAKVSVEEAVKAVVARLLCG